MPILSEESLLLAKNWETVEDILRAEKQLKDELSKLLLSIRADLEKYEWWANRWAFEIYDSAQIYISNQAWLIKDDYAVWIGCEDFAPANIFGVSSAPSLYVWVPDRRYDLAQLIATELKQRQVEVKGEFDTNLKNGYVVREPLNKCLPDEVETYPETARRQILEFFSHYAQLLTTLDLVIKQYTSG